MNPPPSETCVDRKRIRFVTRLFRRVAHAPSKLGTEVPSWTEDYTSLQPLPHAKCVHTKASPKCDRSSAHSANEMLRQ